MFNILAYNFFINKYKLRELGYDGSDKLSVKQFIVMGSIFIFLIVISILLRKAKKDKLYLIYKILAIVMPVLEVIKITFETHYDLLNGQPFNWGGIMPFYTCSMLLYFLPFVAWGKGKMKEWSMAFFSTIGLVAGLSNFVYLSAAGFYPILTFGCMHSILYHSAVVFVGLSLLITSEFNPSFKSIIDGMIPIVMFSIIVIPINFIVRRYTNDTWVDYMLLMNANGFVPKFSDFFDEHHIKLLFSLFMLFIAYPIGTALITLIDMGIIRFVKLFTKKEEA